MDTLSRCIVAGCVGLLAACASIPKAPTVIRIAVPTYVPVPQQLTAACPIAQPTDATDGELLRVARERRASLESCNSDKIAIRGLSGSPVK